MVALAACTPSGTGGYPAFYQCGVTSTQCGGIGSPGAGVPLYQVDATGVFAPRCTKPTICSLVTPSVCLGTSPVCLLAPVCMMCDVSTCAPLLARAVQLWYLFRRDGPLDEPGASSLSAWAQGYQEVRKNLRDSITRRGYYKPESSRFSVKRDILDEIELYALRSERERKNMVQSVSQGGQLRKRTCCSRCQQLGHMARECKNQASKYQPQSAAKGFFSARRQTIGRVWAD